MADEGTMYLDSSRRSEQLSCTKYFYPSYKLFYMIFQNFKQFSRFVGFNLISKLNRKMLCVHRSVHSQWLTGGVGGQVDPVKGLTGQQYCLWSPPASVTF